MKKILCLILALCCVLSTALIITSCDKGGAAPQDPATQTEDPDKAFFDAVAASRATEIKTLTYYTYIDEDGEEKSFNGTFETSIKANGDFVFDYTYQRAAKISDVNDPAVTLDGNVATIPGTIYYENGRYSYNGEDWFTAAPEEISNQPKLNLSKEALGANYVINDSKTSITATLSAEAAKAVLGMEISATGDVVIVVSTNGSYLTRLTVTYESDDGKYKIDSSYS